MSKIVDVSEFKAFFDKKVVVPLKKRIKSSSKQDEFLNNFLKFVEEHLADILFRAITKASKSRVPGVLKYAGVVGQLAQAMEAYKLGKFLPFIIPVVELSVRFIYQKYVESFFDKYGIEDTFEQWLGFSVDSEKVPVPQSASPQPTPAISSSK